MRASSLLPILVTAITPVVQAEEGGLKFTGPSTGTPLNLSASAIEITWSLDRDSSIGNWQYWRQFDLYFVAEASEDSIVSYPIGENVSIPDGDGSYSWDPSEFVDSLTGNGNDNVWLASGRKHHFEGHTETLLHHGGTTIASKKYSVEGFERIGNSAAGLVRSLRAVAGGLMTLTAAHMIL